MATKRIKRVQQDLINDQIRLLYDDGSQGSIFYGEILKRPGKGLYIKPESLVGLTLKQAKMKLGVR